MALIAPLHSIIQEKKRKRKRKWLKEGNLNWAQIKDAAEERHRLKEKRKHDSGVNSSGGRFRSEGLIITDHSRVFIFKPLTALFWVWSTLIRGILPFFVFGVWWLLRDIFCLFMVSPLHFVTYVLDLNLYNVHFCRSRLPHLDCWFFLNWYKYYFILFFQFVLRWAAFFLG